MFGSETKKTEVISSQRKV